MASGRGKAAPEWIKAANQRLKGLRVSLELSAGGNTIHLRGTFPPKPWEPDQQTRQRKISLKRRAIAEADVKAAEHLARQVDLDLNVGTFEWTNFPGIVDPRPPLPSTIADWVKELEKDRRHKMRPSSWRFNYELVMETLPLEAEMSESALINWVLEVNGTGNTMRKKYVAIAAGLADLAGLPVERIRKLQNAMPKKPVNPRDLPEDAAIEAMWRSIQHPEWAWVYGMLAVYGLRPHELFRLDLSFFPDVRVLPNTKTGERIVPPIHPEWLELFKLTNEIRLPQNLQWEPEDENYVLGKKIGMGFDRHHLGDAYSLRHCCARRCLELGLTSDVSAKLFGHSREIHERTYRAFIKSSVYVDAAKRAIGSGR